MKNLQTEILIVGAGPSGLTAGFKLIDKKEFIIIEKSPNYVGGISRTEKYKNFKFDIGGHRFFSKSKEINKLWDQILPHDIILRKRSSRILFRNKFYSYPLKPFQALLNLGLIESILVVLSYIKVKIIKNKNINSYQDWVIDKFGKRLFENFFETYTEKVWGMKCNEISSDWAAQRIKGLDLKKLIINSLFKKKDKKIKTLIEEFKYPRKGPGMLWEAAKDKIIENDKKIFMNADAYEYEYSDKHKVWNVKCKIDNEDYEITCKQIINSAPLKEVINNIKPNLKIKDDAKLLKYRDFITVAVILDYKLVIEDNWIYLHDPDIKAGRLQNFASWSPEMIDQSRECACIGLEYFCNEGDNFWSSNDDEILKIATKDLEKISIINTNKISDFKVVRQEKAYPVYDENYKNSVSNIINKLTSKYETMHMVGRNGMHKYNNQDHAMMSSILTVKNILNNNKENDPWKINIDAEYHEEKKDQLEALKSLREYPKKINQI